MRRRKLLGDERGVASVELALVLSVFSLLLAGAIDLGGVLFV